jgi:hypothetical protein
MRTIGAQRGWIPNGIYTLHLPALREMPGGNWGIKKGVHLNAFCFVKIF